MHALVATGVWLLLRDVAWFDLMSQAYSEIRHNRNKRARCIKLAKSEFFNQVIGDDKLKRQLHRRAERGRELSTWKRENM